MLDTISEYGGQPSKVILAEGGVTIRWSIVEVLDGGEDLAVDGDADFS